MNMYVRVFDNFVLYILTMNMNLFASQRHEAKQKRRKRYNNASLQLSALGSGGLCMPFGCRWDHLQVFDRPFAGHKSSRILDF